MADSRLIQGVWLKSLITHADERGFFREVIRTTDKFFTEGFAQWSHSLGHTGVIKAWHIHQKQTDFFYLPFGVAKVVLHDCREDSPTYRFTNEFMMGDGYDPFVLKIPPGVAHGLKVIQGPAHLFYITSRVYDPQDEGRIPHDDKTINYDWLKGAEIKEMDNKLQTAEVKQIPPWLKHFLIHVVKRCAVILVAWIDEVKELSKDNQIEHAGSNGRLNR